MPSARPQAFILLSGQSGAPGPGGRPPESEIRVNQSSLLVISVKVDLSRLPKRMGKEEVVAPSKQMAGGGLRDEL